MLDLHPHPIPENGANIYISPLGREGRSLKEFLKKFFSVLPSLRSRSGEGGLREGPRVGLRQKKSRLMGLRQRIGEKIETVGAHLNSDRCL
jgi:hypothetical protein